MSKTKPIGVRFREDVLGMLNEKFKIETPQRALVFLERFYFQHHKLAEDITQVLRKDSIQKLPKPISSLKPKELPKEPFVQNPTRPKNLEELKALCPSELIGLDRSNWIALERQKYGI